MRQQTDELKLIHASVRQPDLDLIVLAPYIDHDYAEREYMARQNVIVAEQIFELRKSELAQSKSMTRRIPNLFLSCRHFVRDFDCSILPLGPKALG